jgi:hypothetical protein
MYALPPGPLFRADAEGDNRQSSGVISREATAGHLATFRHQSISRQEIFVIVRRKKDLYRC